MAKLKVRNGMFRCREASCDRADFKTEQAENIHWMRIHGPKAAAWANATRNAARRGRGKSKKNAVTPATPDSPQQRVGEKMLSIVTDILQKYPDGLSRSQLTNAMIAGGISGKPESIATYIGQVIKRHPEANIVQPRRGLYKIESATTNVQTNVKAKKNNVKAKKNKNGGSAPQNSDPVDTMTDAELRDEIIRLRADGRRKSDMILRLLQQQQELVILAIG